MSFQISARNNLDIPIRLTVISHNKIHGSKDSRILITIGEEGATLKSYYSVCVDADVPPTQDWEGVGVLEVTCDPKVSIKGEEAS